MITTTIIFDHRGRTKAGCEGPLEVRITIDRKPYYINTGVRVRKSEWKYSAVVDRVDCIELNERLAIIMRRVQGEINKYMDDGRAVDIQEIRERITMTVEEQTDDSPFLSWIEEQINQSTKGAGTKKHYVTMLKRLLEFGKMKRWNDVNIENIYTFDSWLHSLTETKRTGEVVKLLSDAGVYNYHKNLKCFLYIAEKVGRIERNPYVRLKGEFKRGEKESVEYLTKDEIQTIRDLELERGSHLDFVRDLFVFQIFTGMAYADVMKFDINNYKKVDGKWIANADRVKSGVAFVAQLLPPVVDILEKYGMTVPHVTNQVYNKSLKKIGELAGIQTKLHTHLGRHTFGTFMLSNDVDIVNLQKMMGHKDIKQTLRYAKTLAQSVHDEFDKIGDILK